METVTIIADKQEVTYQVSGPVSVLVLQPGMKVDVPGYVEVNSQTTASCMKAMSQKAWVHISTGQLFGELFKIMFPAVGIPGTIEELNESSRDVVHVAGLIVQSCEAKFAGNKVFMRNPENDLHPATVFHFMSMINRMNDLLRG